jgi:hypothetical protein
MANRPKFLKNGACCIACGFREYEKILRTDHAAPVICFECRQEIDPRLENPKAFNTAILFAHSDLSRRIALWRSER